MLWNSHLPMRLVDTFILCAVQQAVCGRQCIEDTLRMLCYDCQSPKLTLRFLDVRDEGHRYINTLVFEEGFMLVFQVPHFKRKKLTWDETVAFITKRQTELAPHLRGPEHNADQAASKMAVSVIHNATGYEVSTEDFAVRVEAGHMRFGAITNAGSIAMNRYRELLGVEC